MQCLSVNADTVIYCVLNDHGKLLALISLSVDIHQEIKLFMNCHHWWEKITLNTLYHDNTIPGYCSMYKNKFIVQRLLILSLWGLEMPVREGLFGLKKCSHTSILENRFVPIFNFLKPQNWWSVKKIVMDDIVGTLCHILILGYPTPCWPSYIHSFKRRPSGFYPLCWCTKYLFVYLVCRKPKFWQPYANILRLVIPSSDETYIPKMHTSPNSCSTPLLLSNSL